MNFDLDQDEQALKDGIRQLCAGRATSERIRAAMATDGIDRELFRELGEAGVFSITLAESDGGLGLGQTHATVVFEELGRALVPGPLVATCLAAGKISGADAGTTVVTSTRRDRAVIPHLQAADHVVIVGEDGLRSLLTREVSASPVARPLDPLTPLHETSGDLPEGNVLAGPEAAAAWRRQTTLLTSALLLGTSLGSLELATAYAKQREQFGRTIGSFQAVKHLLADCLTRSEVARAAVYAAACHLDDETLGDPDTALASAALLAGEAAMKNAKTCIQVHGGMGFTWEVDAHLHLKRAMVWLTDIDGVAANEERVASRL